MEINIPNHRQPGYIAFIQNRLSSLAVIFVTLYAIALTLSSIIENKSLSFQSGFQHWIGFIVWLVIFLLLSKLSSRYVPHQDPYILHLVFISCGWGLMVIWRLSPYLGLRQTIWYLIGSMLYLFILKYPKFMHILKKYTNIWLTLGFILILLTLLPGLLDRSAQPSLWLQFKGFTLQPSEPLKLLFIVYLSAYLSKKKILNAKLQSYIFPTVLITIGAVLILLVQKDLGTVSLIIAIYVVMVFVGTGDRRFLIGGVIVFLTAFIAGFFLFDVIQLRVHAWINPWIDPEGRSYQIIQALISQAAGGILGTGPGMGSPTLVPVTASDFIFSAIAEESGVFGSAGVVLLLVLFSFRGFSIANRVKSTFLSMLAFGISFWLVTQGLLIIGGNIRLFPLTGLTLPFFSYGGSSLIVCLITAGILTQISEQQEGAIEIAQPRSIDRGIILSVILITVVLTLILLPYWAIVKKDDLISRSDNLRRAIADSFVIRGNLVDRNGVVINSSEGISGNYIRNYSYPPLSSTTGYSNFYYGQSGLESFLDSFLRGLESNPPLNIWWSNLVYNHPPAGATVRLSIDLNLQKTLDEQLGNHTGTIIAMNAQSGEILSIVSHPWIDPSNLDSIWEAVVTDPKSPLLNRALQGSYPPGTVLGPFLMADALDKNLPLPEGSNDSVSYKGMNVECTIKGETGETYLSDTLQRGCPHSLLEFGRILGKSGLYDLYSKIGFFSYPQFIFQGPTIHDPGGIENLKAASIGQESLSVTPLQMVIAASSISANGQKPSPILAPSYQLSNGEWRLIESISNDQLVFTKKAANTVNEAFTTLNFPSWGVVGKGLSSTTNIVTWFVGGTNSSWQGVPVAFAILLEEDNPTVAIEIGKILIRQITNSQIIQ